MRRQSTINYQFQLLAIDLRLLDKTFGSNLTGGQCSCPVAASARGGVAKMAHGVVWLVGSRGRGSRWIGGTFSLFPFSFSPHPVGNRSPHRLFAGFLSFPTHPFHVPSRKDRGELLGAVVWPCDWIGAADRGRPWPETWSWLRIAPGSGQQH